MNIEFHKDEQQIFPVNCLCSELEDCYFYTYRDYRIWDTAIIFNSKNGVGHVSLLGSSHCQTIKIVTHVNKHFYINLCPGIKITQI